jgi:hypothetical protein
MMITTGLSHLAFNINEFLANINRYGIVKPSNFTITVSKKIPEPGEQPMVFRMMATDLPARDMLTSERRIYGPTERFGIDLVPGQIQIAIILSENFSEKDYFDRWMDLMIGKYRRADTPAGKDTNRFEIGYYDDYVGSAQITIFSDTGMAIHQVNLVDVFPKTIGQVQLSWTNGAEILILPVQFFYRYYTNPEPAAIG